ncbi:hypothetical protein RO3G_14071 [Rhizopus delemar RA 99-880]|uniref:Uncharacterized protein n=1 Tax=Rhizopus delemar (strain RA 99-880 / ATCC MYA-4621 / FGSC 9543 / NRRL 43880) TaxID=246409 RepID=I1CLN0_RHIO9|nr:hypothetical protein RO3G_14071 [Rhizopus delemar RA 99-880]|eukprot:EIE89360.1 hypothetical protein RO3G_14071 [Rhizopus delemar RA 99-880]
MEAVIATTTLLGTEFGSRSSSRHFSAELEDQEALSISTLETNSAGSEANQGAEIKKNKTSDTTTAVPNLVYNNLKMKRIESSIV